MSTRYSFERSWRLPGFVPFLRKRSGQTDRRNGRLNVMAPTIKVVSVFHKLSTKNSVSLEPYTRGGPTPVCANLDIKTENPNWTRRHIMAAYLIHGGSISKSDGSGHISCFSFDAAKTTTALFGLVGWLIGFIILDRGAERTRQQSQNVYNNCDSCLVVLVDLFAQTERASNIFKKCPGLEGRGRFLV